MEPSVSKGVVVLLDLLDLSLLLLARFSIHIYCLLSIHLVVLHKVLGFAQGFMVDLLKFVHGLICHVLEIELILIRGLVAANQCFLLDSPVLLLHLEEPVEPWIGHLLQGSVSQGVQLLTIELIVVVFPLV